MSDHTIIQIQQNKPIPLQLQLSLKKGEFLALVGPSGAGKTTLLRILAGLTQPENGFIQIGTQCCLNTQMGINLSPQERPVGLVFQNYALFPHLNALENIEMALQSLPRKLRREKARHWLERVQLSHRSKARPNTLSGGEMQRLALARALAREPQLLLLDEPFAAIDQSLRKQLYLELAQWRDDLNLSLILVTHEIQEAVAFADQMALIKNGKLLQWGPPSEIQNHPSHPEVVKMLGNENLFRVTRAGSGQFYWQEGPIHLNLPHEFAQAEAAHFWVWIPEAEIRVQTVSEPMLDTNTYSAQVNRCQRLGNVWHLRLSLPLGSQVNLSWPSSLPLGQKLLLTFPETALKYLPYSEA